MAEFCLECYNELHGTHYTKEEVTLDWDLCEGCGQVKPCIVVFRPPSIGWRLREWLEKKRKG